jgi:DNA-3-methyladenine glycosylase II
VSVPASEDEVERWTTAAAEALADRDPVLARLHAELGVPRFDLPTESPFASLVRGICFQQIAGPAATAIHRRLLGELGGVATPEAVAGLTDEAFRRAGLSTAKVRSLRDLASKVLAGEVDVVLDDLRSMSDEEVVRQLTTVRGIGPWSAELFLIFQLRRLDVWPTGDLAVRKGFGRAWGLPEPPTQKQLDLLGEPFRPYRTVVAWYCWAVAAERTAAHPIASAPPLGAAEETTS